MRAHKKHIIPWLTLTLACSEGSRASEGPPSPGSATEIDANSSSTETRNDAGPSGMTSASDATRGVTMKDGVSLLGGYKADDWFVRDVVQYPSRIIDTSEVPGTADQRNWAVDGGDQSDSRRQTQRAEAFSLNPVSPMQSSYRRIPRP